MLARDLMRQNVRTIREDRSIGDLLDMFVRERIHGAPVLDAGGALVGVVTQQDVFFGSMTRSKSSGSAVVPEGLEKLQVKDIMTAPAVSATEDTDLPSLCRMMYKLRIHRVPITREGKLVGIVSSLDVCAAIGRGELG